MTIYPARRVVDLISEAGPGDFVLGVIAIIVGLVMGLLLGWEFVAGEFIGGPLMIVLVALVFRVFLKKKLVDLVVRTPRVELRYPDDDMAVSGQAERYTMSLRNILFAALNFAHRALCAAAIFLRAATESAVHPTVQQCRTG